MNATEHLLYALADYNSVIHAVDYTLPEAANFLLTGNGDTYEISADSDGWHTLRFTNGSAARYGAALSGGSEAVIFQQVVDTDGYWHGYEAVPQHRPSGWWKIGPHNGQAMYAWGDRAEAEEFALHLDNTIQPKVLHFASPVSWHDAYYLDLAEFGDINLADELCEIRAAT